MKICREIIIVCLGFCLIWVFVLFLCLYWDRKKSIAGLLSALQPSPARYVMVATTWGLTLFVVYLDFKFLILILNPLAHYCCFPVLRDLESLVTRVSVTLLSILSQSVPRSTLIYISYKSLLAQQLCSSQFIPVSTIDGGKNHGVESLIFC